MIRLFIRAGLVAAVTGMALTQLQTRHRLLAWELVLLGVLLFEMRELPSGRVVNDRPLFRFSTGEPARLPRAVSSTELIVVDVLTGRLSPDRRLQPVLRRIASHRLHKRGIEFDSATATATLGEPEWLWLATPATRVPDAGELENVVAKLEGT